MYLIIIINRQLEYDKWKLLFMTTCSISRLPRSIQIGLASTLRFHRNNKTIKAPIFLHFTWNPKIFTCFCWMKRWTGSLVLLCIPVLRPISTQLVTRWFFLNWNHVPASTCKMDIYRTIPSILVFWFNYNVECWYSRLRETLKEHVLLYFCAVIFVSYITTFLTSFDNKYFLRY